MSVACVCLPLVLVLFGISWASAEDPQQCYRPSTVPVPETAFQLPEISTDDLNRPKPGHAIFFHETSCASKYATLTVRQACAVESASRKNPGREIYVLFASPRVLDGTEPEYLKVLSTRSNVNFYNADLWAYAKNTPAERLLHSNAMFRGPHRNLHVAQLLRYLSLFKFQGTYLDLDTVTLQELPPRATYAVAEDAKHVGTALLSLDSSLGARRFARYFLGDFLHRFNDTLRGQGSADVVTRVLTQICEKGPLVKCPKFKVLPTEAAYAVDRGLAKAFFAPRKRDHIFRLLKKSLVVHLWHQTTAGVFVKKGARSAYEVLAQMHCPQVYQSAGGLF